MTDDEQNIRDWIRARRIAVTPDGRIRICQATAELVGVHERTLRRWAEEGIGPEVIQIGRSRWYRLESLIAWIVKGDNPDISDISDNPYKAAGR